MSSDAQHSDRLYLRCTFCTNFVLLARTNANTRQFWDPAAVEAFIRLHLQCNPFYAMDTLCGESGFEVTAWSEASDEDEKPQNYTFDLPPDLLDILGE